MKFTLEQINELEKRRLTEAELFYLRLRVNMTLQQVADYMGISRQWAAKIIESATAKAKTQLDVHA